MDKKDIKQIIRDHKQIFGKYKIKSLELFGSYARGDQTDDSDIDLLVEFKEPTFRNYIGMLNEFRALFNKKVDLICKDSLKQKIKSYILEEAEALP